MPAVTFLKSSQACCTEGGPISTAGCVWERGLLSHEQAEALGFRSASSAEAHRTALGDSEYN